MSASAAGPLAALTRYLAALAEDAASRPVPCRTLTAAAARGDVDLVRAFLDDGADIQERTIGFESPLAAAASAGHLPVVDLLLERGASLDQPDAMFPILHFPILHQRALMIEHLLRAGAPRDKHRRHLRLMAKERHWAVVDAMLEGGMDPAWLDADHRAALEAWRAENPDRLAAWRAAEAEADARRVTPSRRGQSLEPTARAAEEAAAMGLVQAHPELAQASTTSGTPLLVVAAQAGAGDLVRALLDAGANPDASGSGPSALMRAAERGDVEMLCLLLDRGADPAARTAQGDTALIAAAAAGSLASVELLLDRGADPRPRARQRATALGVACGPQGRRIRERLERALADWAGRRSRPGRRRH